MQSIVIVSKDFNKGIQKALEHALANRTVIAIAHRLSTIQKADNIITLSHGHIIEQGSHSELISKNSSYKKYYDLQLKN